MAPPQTQILSDNTSTIYPVGPFRAKQGPQKVFVYGTLKKGYGNHERFLKDSRELGQASVEGIMFHLGGCPAINLGEKFSWILGEVYEVDWPIIERLDILEGVANGFYSRIEAEVQPQGVVWMYIFPHQKASKERWVIPSGNWKGSDTTMVKWGGFGKGVEIGCFETDIDEIRIGPTTKSSDFVLRRSGLDQTYKLLNKKTGEILGSYSHLRDMIGTNGRTKPVLRLPASVRTPLQVAVSEEIRQLPPPPVELASSRAQDEHPGIPIVWDSAGNPIFSDPLAPPEKEEDNTPQAVQFLALKYGEA